MKPIIHYIFDPLCGWCYAAEPLIRTLATSHSEKFELRLHGGGLFGDPAPLPEGMPAYIRNAVGRVHQLTGQTFGPAFLDELLLRQDARWSSLPAIRAVLAASMNESFSGLRLLNEVQRLHFKHGNLLNDSIAFGDAAAQVGINRSDFEFAFQQLSEGQVLKHVAQSRELLHRVGGTGFPTFALERGGRIGIVAHAPHYGDPDGFVQQVLRLTVNSIDEPAGGAVINV